MLATTPLGTGDTLIHGALLVLASLLAAAHPVQECVAAPSAPELDHVVLVVRDLDRAAATFRAHGFRLKQGRLHGNNLLNRHVKFRDGTSLELMSIQGEPRDAMAQDYADLAAAGEGGVYVALRVADVAAAGRVAAALRLDTRRSTSGPWQFVSFAPSSPAAAVFFSAGTAVQDADSLVSHEPDVLGLDEAWVEGGPGLVALLERLGATRCGAARSSNGLAGERLALRKGSVVVVPMLAASRPRVLGVVLKLRTAGDRTGWPHPAFRVHYRFDDTVKS
jgi:catechol 2,3-dioxygenase-like lactoylglutathione lyase family enzyme